MLWLIASFTLILVIGLACFAFGKGLAVVFRLPWVLNPSLEGAIVAVLLGTGALTLLTAWLSYLGVSARVAIWPVLLVWGCAVGVAYRGSVLRISPSALKRGLVVLLLSNICYLLPLAHNRYAAMNDTFCYISISDVLQKKPYSPLAKNKPDAPVQEILQKNLEERLDNPMRPLFMFFNQYQKEHFRMGAIFFLSLVQAFLGPSVRAIEVFPVAVGWSLGLLGLAVFLLARWSFRIPRSVAFLFGCLAVTVPNPVNLAAAEGFFPQAFGLPIALFVLALLSRILRKSHRAFGHALLLAFSLACLICSYTEVFPLFALTALMTGAFVVTRSFKRGSAKSAIPFVITVLVAFVILANVEILRMFLALPGLVHVVTGYHFDWNWFDYASFALGVGSVKLMGNKVQVIALFAAFAIFAWGAFRIARRRGLPLMGILVCFGGLAVYFAAFVRDPWSGQIGHTFSLYKLCCWSFPVLFVIEAIGFTELYSRFGIVRRVAPWAVFFGIALLLPKWSTKVAARERSEDELTQRHSDRPFDALREAASVVGLLHPSVVYLVGQKGVFWTRMFASYYLHPLNTLLVGEDYSKDYIQFVDQNPGDPTVKRIEADPVYLGVTENYYQQGTQLPGGWVLFSQGQPIITRIFPEVAGQTEVEVWARSTRMQELRVTPSGSAGITVRVGDAAAPEMKRVGGGVFSTEVMLNAGYNRLRVDSRSSIADLKFIPSGISEKH